MAQVKIKRGDPQPVDCPECGTKQGYQVSIKMVTDFVDFYFHDGTSEGGAYGDYQRVIYESTSAHCMNCITKLPFKIDINNP